MDIHVAAVLAFDTARQLRMLTLAQHNHQQNFLAGIDFPPNQKALLVAVAKILHRKKKDMQATNWKAMVNFMRKRLARAISKQIHRP